VWIKDILVCLKTDIYLNVQSYEPSKNYWNKTVSNNSTWVLFVH